MERSRQESARAEIEFVNRTAEYNFETLKGQIENLNSENGFFKMQNEKQKKSIEIMRATNERMAQDLEHYKKVSLAQQARTNKAKTGATPLKPQEAITSAAPVVQSFAAPPLRELVIASGFSRQEIFRKPGEPRECQVNTLDPAMLTKKDEEILYL